MTYDDALAFWYGRINYEVRAANPADLKLERMRALLRHVGDPHDRVRLVHVTGTKGKGSTAAMVAAVLRAAGWILARKTLQAWAAKPGSQPIPTLLPAVDALWAAA